ncbi:glycosyl hydrolase family 8 [Roseomonas marmotae]|uniref:Glucanase n=1 Tax=Roseomonas marmotae TaxID=2768161 RepID=A0ABS3KDS5_9PROT|nr:glycosyl hydrolase family 8 [Roseomonas marmotae]MBO1075622.1 glycosyl hydrolase family 5 [Roseomonas marmotae]QTI79484.1 glycosyl hydrolase family 5 [Roseomonas marmotae]
MPAIPPAPPPHGLPRRALMGGVLAGLAAAPPPARAGEAPPEAPPALRQAWRVFRARFLLPEGRVVDTGNQGISHSEGQGWALLCAERCDDREGFDLLLGWTRQALRRPQDSLHAWRYRPGAAQGFSDRNNASDGDLFIAAALLLAARRWAQPAYAGAGRAIARDVLRLLLRRVAGYTVLLPGAAGFEDAEGVILNPSYYAFPAIRLLAQAVPDPAWLRLVADGVGLLRGARFGRWGLPPDWLALRRAGGLAGLAPGRPPRFSYDAVRVPLYLAWSGLVEEPAVRAALGFWNDPGHPHPPAWVDLVTDRISPYPASGGIEALRDCLRRGEASGPALTFTLEERDDYYAAMLKILSMISTIR